MSRIIDVKNIELPKGYDFKEADGAWQYTCRVCDGDVYDQTHSSNLSDFLSLEE